MNLLYNLAYYKHTNLSLVVLLFEPLLIQLQHLDNQDHNQLTHASLIASRPTLSFIDSVFMFNTPSSTEWGFPRNFKPDTWVDISSTIEVKIKAFECYKSENKAAPHPRSKESLISHSKYWGSHQLINYAEVFRTVWNRSKIY